jgi:hypothetical protein
MKTVKMGKVARFLLACLFYAFVWKKSDLTIFTKKENFRLVKNGKINAEKMR